jgi:hypothetical protein
VLAIIAAAISAAVAILIGNATDISTLLNSVTIAVIIYLLSYYFFKATYKNKIEKQSKILSTAIGMYFFTWIAFFVLFYTTIKVLIP